MWYEAKEFNKALLSDLGLSFRDVILIRCLISNYTSPSARWIYLDNKLYVVTTYSRILKNLQIINFSKEDIVEGLKSYEKLGLVELNTFGGEYAVYSFTDKIAELVRL